MISWRLLMLGHCLVLPSAGDVAPPSAESVPIPAKSLPGQQGDPLDRKPTPRANPSAALDPESLSRLEVLPPGDDHFEESPGATSESEELRQAMETYGSDLLSQGDDSASPAEPLSLQQAIESMKRFFPLLREAELRRAFADGSIIAALGAFDRRIVAEAIPEPLGFYKTMRAKLNVIQPIQRNGTDVFAGYRIGRGLFPDWYGERATDEGGEFAAGFNKPLLRRRAIDQRRADLLKSSIDRSLAEPTISKARIEFTLATSIAYWSWVEAGFRLRVAQDLVRTAKANLNAVEKQFRAKVAAGYDVTDRERVLFLREARLNVANQAFQDATLRLALFLRLPDGSLIVPGKSRLPALFPDPKLPAAKQLEEILDIAFAGRPELAELDYEVQRVRIDLELARNDRKADLDFIFKASKDVGALASSKGDKRPFELIAGLEYKVPVQRRNAIGRQTEAQTRLAQLTYRRQFVRDSIDTQVRAALVDLLNRYREVDSAERSVIKAREIEVLERKRFFLGQGDVFLVIAREQQTAEAADTLIDALASFFRAEAQYRASLGLD